MPASTKPTEVIIRTAHGVEVAANPVDLLIADLTTRKAPALAPADQHTMQDTLLTQAIAEGNVAAVQRMIEEGADISPPTPQKTLVERGIAEAAGLAEIERFKGNVQRLTAALGGDSEPAAKPKPGRHLN